MWWNVLDNNYFIKKLYNKIPELNHVKICKIKIHDEGHRASIIFNLPYYPDNPPQKWIDLKYNTAYVQVDFTALHNLYIESLNPCGFIGYIKMNIDSNELINVDIIGTLKANIKAESGMIQHVKACIVDPWSEES